jgi:sugar lactone lactonase YvrE
VSATTQLTDLPAGSYTVTAATAVLADPVVNTVYLSTVSGSPAAVVAGHSVAARVSYAMRPGSGAVWLIGGAVAGANTANAAVAYTASQLQGGAPTPTVTFALPVTSGHNIDPSAIALDAQGNVWVVNDNSNTIVEYTTAQLTASGSPTPAVTLQEAALTAPYALAFDAQGNLWVGNNGACTIVEFTASQLTASGSPTPAVTIHDGDPFTNEPGGFAFDSAGNLWVANNAVSTIVEYSASQLAASGSPTPVVTISSAALAWPQGLAFDRHGNLWVANTGVVDTHGNIVEFAGASLTTSGSPAATVTLTPPTSTFGTEITDVAFDNGGNLWYTDLSSNSIGEFTTAQLTASGSPTPAVSIPIANTVYPTGLVFSPPAAGLPIH